MNEQLVGSLLNHDSAKISDRRSKGDDAFQDAVKNTRDKIAGSFKRGQRIPARRKID